MTNEFDINTLKLIAAATAHLQVNGIAGARVPMPGTDKVIVVGSQKWVDENTTPVPRVSAAEQPSGNLVINSSDLMSLARRLIAEDPDDCDEEFLAGRAHGIGSLHADILGLAPQSPAPEKASVTAVPVELAQVQEQIKEGAGFWQTCSGCHESEDGYDNGHYPYSAPLGCKLGMGCRECGGIGAIWDNTDYEAMAADMFAAPVAQEVEPGSAPAAADEVRDAALVKVLNSGNKMANTMFNLAQCAGQMIDSDLAAKFDKMRKEWDSARVALKTTASAATSEQNGDAA